MMTLLGIAGLLFLVWAVRSVGNHPTQDASDASIVRKDPPEPVAPSVSKARQQAVDGSRLTPEEREALADLRADRLAKRNHDTRMAAAAGLAGVVAGAALAHHHDAIETQNHIDLAAASQRDAFAQAMNYDSGDGFDGDDDFYADSYDNDTMDQDADAYFGDDSDYDDGYVSDDDWPSDDSGFDDGGFDDDFGGDDFDI